MFAFSLWEITANLLYYYLDCVFIWFSFNEHTKRNTGHDHLQAHSCMKTDWQDKMLLSSLQLCVDTVAAIWCVVDRAS